MDIWNIIVDILTLILSVVALVISCNSNKQSKQANLISQKADEKANLLEQGQLELNIREMISTARYRQIQIGVELSKDKENQALLDAFDSASEDLLNAYDEACTKYLDGKIDTTRFKKSYFDDLRNVYGNSEFNEFFNKRPPRFQAIERVCREWYELEK